MRICYLANASTGHMERWVKYFVEQGHDVHMISFEEPRTKMEGVTIHHVPTRKKLIIPFTFYKKIGQFKKIIEEIQPDIVHGHYITKYGIMAPFVGFQPYVLSAWGSDLLLDVKGVGLGQLLKRYAKKTIQKAQNVHTDGIKTKQAILDLGGEEDKILLSFFGIESDSFTRERRSEELRNKL
ncbi:MAG: glycosyltransferase, partial [Candidatus Thorarchaeota archaeon]